MPKIAEILKQKFSQSLGLPLSEMLPDAEIEQALKAEGIIYRESIYTPWVTLWAFIWQVLSPDKSCRQVVSRIIGWLALEPVKLPSLNTGAYSHAKQRLPENWFKRLVEQTGAGLSRQAQSDQLWEARVVKVLEGSSLLMNDTPANQKAYPQSSNQKAGCGFPLARIVVMFHLGTGALLHAAIAAFKTSELALSRGLYQCLQPQDVAIGDRLYGTYVDLASVQARQADGLFRCHSSRNTERGKRRRFGDKDYLVQWNKPSKGPAHLSQAAFDELPAQLSVRLVYIRPYWK